MRGATGMLAMAAGCAASAGPLVIHEPGAPPAGEAAGAPAPPGRLHPVNERPLVIRAGTVWTISGEALSPGEVLVVDGRIAEVGRTVRAPADAEVVEAPGGHLTPGLIDTHSHLGVYPTPHLAATSDGNEMTQPTTPHVRAEDAVWTEDPGMPRALAGGVTAMQVLPGSGNLIGGRGVVLKLRPARSAAAMRFAGAPDTLKMACGENPKRVYGERRQSPSTRMGNLAGYRAAFQKAAEYRRRWERHRDKVREWEEERADKEREEAAAARKQAGRLPLDRAVGGDKKKRKDKGKDKPEPPDRDFGLELLAAVLRGEALVQMHCYRGEEMLQMIALAEEFGFRIRSFHHAVEAYKIRDVLAAREVAVSTWADWWGFKLEAFDGIPENAALVAAAGGRAIIHSDSGIGIQRLNQEAAKAYHAGRAVGLDLPEREALRWVTLNPAWALGVDARAGSIEPGKDADLVLWSGHPLSVYAHADRVWIDGVRYHDRARGPRPSDFELGLREDGSP